MQLLNLLERVIEPYEPVLRLPLLHSALDRPNARLDRARRAALVNPSVHEGRDEGGPELEVGAFRRAHALVERVFDGLAEEVADLGREDFAPSVGKVVEEEDGSESRAMAEGAGTGVEGVEESS